MKTYHSQGPYRAPGFAALLTVLTVGLILLLLMVSLYRNTASSQETMRNNALRSDYQFREEAFLRSFVSLTPNAAVKTMQNGNGSSVPGGVPFTNGSIQWRTIMNTAIVNSNVESVNDAGVESLLGVAVDGVNVRSANTGDTTSNFLYNTISEFPQEAPFRSFGSVAASAMATCIDITATSAYPPPLTTAGNGVTQRRDSNFPLISHHKSYGVDADGWVGAPVNPYSNFNILPAPPIRFAYGEEDTIIAKHNWWAFDLNMAAPDRLATGLDNAATFIDDARRYIFSIYEVPSQQAINANSLTVLGQHADGSAWGSNININGGIFAEGVQTEGSFSTTSLSTRRGANLSSDTVLGGDNFGSNPFESQDLTANPTLGSAPLSRELAEVNGVAFPISSSSDGGKAAFIPINRGLQFYDRFDDSMASIADADAIVQNDGSTRSNSSWAHYSIGAHQCTLNIDVVAIDDTDAPSTLRIRYTEADGSKVTLNFSKDDGSWPDLLPTEDLRNPGFPIDLSETNDRITNVAGIVEDAARPALVIYMNRLIGFLRDDIGVDLTINNKISVNVDYTGFVNDTTTPEAPFAPSFPSADNDTSLILRLANDLTEYGAGGFSLVTNLRLIIDSEVNTTPFTGTLPVGVPNTGDYFIPLSLFAPEKVFGSASGRKNVEINGQLGSLSTDNTSASRIADLVTGTGVNADGSAAIIANSDLNINLNAITHPGNLPPINMMNWLVVVRPHEPLK